MPTERFYIIELLRHKGWVPMLEANPKENAEIALEMVKRKYPTDIVRYRKYERVY